MSDLDELLGIDRSDPLQQLAADIVGQSEDFIEALRQHRVEMHLSPRVVAERMGVTPNAVRAFENGVSDVTMSFLRRYLHAVRAHAGYAIVTMEES